MELLFKHNLISGWRNILKYKTQNIISALCLSVGTLFFAIVLWFVIGIGHTNPMSTNWGANCYKVSIAYDSYNNNKNLIPDILNTIKKSKYIDDVNYCFQVDPINIFITNPNIEITHANSVIHYTTSGKISVISPNWCKFRNIKSAVTGKKLNTLKSGTLMLSDRFKEKSIKKDISPLEFEYSHEGQRIKVTDVINTSFHFGTIEDIFLVDDFEEQSILKILYISDLYVSPKEGVSREQIETDLNTRLKKYVGAVGVFPVSEDKPVIYMLIGIFLFLGSSILAIGVSGYMKMQIQLFNLRSREMALRRCNGAKPLHLFGLLGAELLIIFFFVAILSILLSVATEAYVMPILHNLGTDELFHFDIEDVFEIEIYVVISTFIVSIIIAWISVYKSLHVSLGKTAGKSYSPQTTWGKALQVVQYIVATILLFFICIVFYGVYFSNIAGTTTNHADYCKRIACFSNFIKYQYIYPLSPDLIENPRILPSAEKMGWSNHFIRTIPEKISTDITPITPTTAQKEEQTVYQYFIRVFTPGFFSIMNEKIYANNDNDPTLIPIYALSKEADQLRNELNLPLPYSNRDFVLQDILLSDSQNAQYKRLGYSHPMDNEKSSYQRTSLYIMRTNQGWKEEQSLNHTEMTFILAKEGKYSKLCDEIKEDIQRKNPQLGNSNIEITNCYYSWFRQIVIIDIISQLCWVIVIISIISIILTVYSSVSLETRGRQKEIAIRKVNGAKTSDIVKLFCRSHVIILTIAFCIALVLSLAILLIFNMLNLSMPLFDYEFWGAFILLFLASALTITLVTFCTIGEKIYKVAHINPAEMVRKE